MDARSPASTCKLQLSHQSVLTSAFLPTTRNKRVLGSSSISALALSDGQSPDWFTRSRRYEVRTGPSHIQLSSGPGLSGLKIAPRVPTSDSIPVRHATRSAAGYGGNRAGPTPSAPINISRLLECFFNASCQAHACSMRSNTGPAVDNKDLLFVSQARKSPDLAGGGMNCWQCRPRRGCLQQPDPLIYPISTRFDA